MAATLVDLRARDERAFRTLADAAPAMFWTTDADGLCNFFNARMLAFCARAAHTLPEAFHPHDRERRERRFARALKKRCPYVLESRMRRADGEWRWVREEASPCFAFGGARFTGFVGVAFDITEYREGEAALERELAKHAAQARGLWLRLADLQESERRRLSTELHDRAGDPLTALRLELAAALQDASGEDERARLERCVAHVRGTADAITDVMKELRPPMLDEHGLAAALRWYATQVSFEVAVSAPKEPPRLPPQVESAFFRIAQECLRNVVRHAQASHVEITLSHDGTRSATLRVEDDGIGFEPGGPWRWGLLTMRERAHAVCARLDIASRAGEGTCVTVSLLEQP